MRTTYTHKLARGVGTHTHYGLDLAKASSMPASVVAAAEEMAENVATAKAVNKMRSDLYEKFRQLCKDSFTLYFQTVSVPSDNLVQGMNCVRLVRRLLLIEKLRRNSTAGAAGKTSAFDLERLKVLQKQFRGDDDEGGEEEEENVL